jgi:putative redox protein
MKHKKRLKFMDMELTRIEAPYVFELNAQNNLKLVMDSSESLEGKNRGMTPMQLLLGGLMGCMSIDVMLVLKKQKMSPKVYRVEADATKKDGVPTPYDKIHLKISIDKEIDLKRVHRAVDLSLNKYCSVRASLHPDISISYEIIPV